MFFVRVKRRQWFTAGRFLVVVRVIESPARHWYLSFDVMWCLVASLPWPMTRLTNQSVNLSFARLGRLLPWLPHQLRQVAAADCADTTAVPVRSRRRRTPSVPVRVVVSPFSPAKLQPTIDRSVSKWGSSSFPPSPLPLPVVKGPHMRWSGVPVKTEVWGRWAHSRGLVQSPSRQTISRVYVAC